MDLSRWAGKNRQLLTLSGVVLTLLIAGGVYYVNFQRSVATQAMNQLESIHQSIDSYLRRSVRAAYAAPVPRLSPRRRRLRHWMRHQLSDLRPFHERYVYRMSNLFPLRPAL